MPIVPLPTAKPWRLVIPGPPVPYAKQRYHPPKQKVAMRRIAQAARSSPPATMYTGAVRLALTFFFRPPASWPKARRLAADRMPAHTQRPDLTNLVKLAEDALTQSGVVWGDDCQVAAIIAEKLWTDGDPSTEITVSEITRGA